MVPFAVAAWLSTAACTGAISTGDPLASPSTPSTPAPGQGNTPVSTPGTGGQSGTMSPSPTTPLMQAAPSGLRLLTVSQYRNALADLLGSKAALALDSEERALAAASAGVSPRLVEQYEAGASAVAHDVLATSESRAALLSCTPTGAADDACLRGFLKTFGRRAFRRPLDSAEIDRYAALAASAAAAAPSLKETAKNPLRGLEIALSALLQSPHFLYRVEVGEPDPAGGTRLTAYELAARLSFLVWNSSPDDALLDAASAGRLRTTDGVASELSRLLAHEKAKAGIESFFADWLDLSGLPTLEKDKTALPEWSATLGAALRKEAMMAMRDHALTRAGDLRALFTTRDTFVNAELAKLYGVAAPMGDTFARVTLPEAGPRAGVLGLGGVLALHAKRNKTFPTGRGLFIRKTLLCHTVPSPPPNVNTTLAPLQPGEKLTLRQQLSRHAKDPTCANCHALFDPLGLALEHFDALGAYRETDDGQNIDVTGTLDDVKFDGARELSTTLAAHPDAMSCFVRQVFRYAAGHVEAPAEEKAIIALTARFEANGRKLVPLLQDLAGSPLLQRPIGGFQ